MDGTDILGCTVFVLIIIFAISRARDQVKEHVDDRFNRIEAIIAGETAELEKEQGINGGER